MAIRGTQVGIDPVEPEFGGTGSDLSATGPGVLQQTTPGANITVGPLDTSVIPSGIDAVKIADGSVTNTEFQYINSLTSNAQTQIDGKSATTHNQALDKGGTGVDLSASGGTTKILAQDASHVISARDLVAADIPNLNASKITTGTLDVARIPTAIPALNIGDGSVTDTEFSYLGNVTSDIQGQLTALGSASVSLTRLSAGTLGVDLVVDSSKLIDWGSAAGSGTVTGTNAQIVRTSAGMSINVPSTQSIDFKSGNSTLGRFSGTGATIPGLYMQNKAVSWYTSSSGSITGTNHELIATSNGPNLNAFVAGGGTFPGLNYVSMSIGGVVQHRFNEYGHFFDTSAGVLDPLLRSITSLSDGLAVHVETGKTFGTYVNGVLQQTLGVNGLTFDSNAGAFATVPSIYRDSGDTLYISNPIASSSVVIRAGGTAFSNWVAQFQTSGITLFTAPIWFTGNSRAASNSTTGTAISSDATNGNLFINAGATKSIQLGVAGTTYLTIQQPRVDLRAVLRFTGSGTTTFAETEIYCAGTSGADSLFLNVPTGKNISFTRNGSSILTIGPGGNSGIAFDSIVGSVGSTAYEIVPASAGMLFGVPTGKRYDFVLGGAAYFQVFETSITSKVPLRWTSNVALTAADYSIGKHSTSQLAINVPTSSTFGVLVNGVVQNTFGVNGITFDTAGGTLASSATTQIVNTSANGLIINAATQSIVSVAGNTLHTYTSVSDIVSVPLLWTTGATVPLGATESGIARRGAQQMEIGYRSGHSWAISCATVLQQTFGLGKLEFNSVTGTVGTTTRGLFSTSTDFAMNVETGATVSTYVNGVLQQSQGINGLQFHTAAGSVVAAVRGVFQLSTGLTYNVPTSGSHIFSVNGGAKVTIDSGSMTLAGMALRGSVPGAASSTLGEIYNNSGDWHINVPATRSIYFDEAASSFLTIEKNRMNWTATRVAITNGTVSFDAMTTGANWNVATGLTHRKSINGVVQQTFDINGIQLNTAAGTVSAAVRGIYTTSPAIVYNAPTGVAHYFAINGANLYSFDSQGFKFISTTGSINAGTPCITYNGNLLQINSPTAKPIGLYIQSIQVLNVDTLGLAMPIAGQSLYVKQGTNASAGTGTLVAGVATIPTTAVATGDLVIITPTSAGGTTGVMIVSAISSGVSFTVTSIQPGTAGISQILDTSTFNWFIIKAA